MHYDISPKKQFMLEFGSACCDEVARGINIVWGIVLAYSIGSIVVMAISSILRLAFKVGA